MNIKVTQLYATEEVTYLKKLTIPWLKFSSAALLAQLMKQVMSYLSNSEITTTSWSNLQVTLCYTNTVEYSTHICEQPCGINSIIQ